MRDTISTNVLPYYEFGAPPKFPVEIRSRSPVSRIILVFGPSEFDRDDPESAHKKIRNLRGSRNTCYEKSISELETVRDLEGCMLCRDPFHPHNSYTAGIVWARTVPAIPTFRLHEALAHHYYCASPDTSLRSFSAFLLRRPEMQRLLEYFKI